MLDLLYQIKANIIIAQMQVIAAQPTKTREEKKRNKLEVIKLGAELGNMVELYEILILEEVGCYD